MNVVTKVELDLFPEDFRINGSEDREIPVCLVRAAERYINDKFTHLGEVYLYEILSDLDVSREKNMDNVWFRNSGNDYISFGFDCDAQTKYIEGKTDFIHLTIQKNG